MSSIDARIARLSEPFAGVVSRRLALDNGVSSSAVRRRVGRGSLVRAFDGVYLVGHASLTPERIWWASVLYADEPCGLSRRSGLEARQLLRDPRPWDVTLAVTSRARTIVSPLFFRDQQIQLTLHESSVLARRTRATKIAGNLPVLSVSDLLVDVAWHAPDDFGDALRNAEYRGLVKDRDLRRVLRMGRSGSSAVREELERRGVGDRHTQNDLEDAGYDLAQALGLPAPQTNVVIMTSRGPVRVDLYWPELGLVIELDGGDAHGTVGGMQRDRKHEAWLRGEGLDVMRFSWRQITYEMDVVADALRGQGYLPAAA